MIFNLKITPHENKARSVEKREASKAYDVGPSSLGTHVAKARTRATPIYSLVFTVQHTQRPAAATAAEAAVEDICDELRANPPATGASRRTHKFSGRRTYPLIPVTRQGQGTPIQKGKSGSSTSNGDDKQEKSEDKNGLRETNVCSAASLRVFKGLLPACS